MSWRIVVVGGIVLHIVVFALKLVTGPLLYEDPLEAAYQERATTISG